MAGKLGPLVLGNTVEVEDHLGEAAAIFGLPLSDLVDVRIIVVVGGAFFRYGAGDTLGQL